MGMPAQWQATDGEGPDHALELYKVAVEEYRFQAQFNWSRTQYLLAFSAAILAAGVGVAGQGRGAALVFALGAVSSLMSFQVTRVQHGYYRNARDHVRRLERRLDLGEDVRLDTTATLGERPKPKVNVTGVINLLFAALAVAHIVGIVVVLASND